MSNLHHILTNPFYHGRFIFRGQAYIGNHEPLISASLFQEVQRMLKQVGKPDYEKRSLAFAGLMVCGHCGGTVTGDIKQGGRYIYYRCSHYRQKCPDKYIREEALVEQYRNAMARLTLTDEQAAWIRQALKEVNHTKTEEVNERRDTLQSEVKRLEARLNRLYEDKLDGVISESFYTMKANEYHGQIAELNGSWERLSVANEDQMRLGLVILDFARNTVAAFDRMDNFEKAELVRIVVSNFSLEGGKVSPNWKKPLGILAENSQNEGIYPKGIRILKKCWFNCSMNFWKALQGEVFSHSCPSNFSQTFHGNPAFFTHGGTQMTHTFPDSPQAPSAPSCGASRSQAPTRALRAC